MITTNSKSLSTEEKVKKVIPLMMVLFVIATLLTKAFEIVSPSIANTFQIDASTASLTVTLSTLVLGIAAIVFGSLSDFLPIKKLLYIGMSVFLIGSILGFVLQQSFIVVVISRILQSIGAASMSSLCLVLINRYLEGNTRLKYLGFFTAMFQLSSAIGVVLGGYISKISWPFIFLVPFISLVFLPSIIKLLPDEESKEAKKIDVVGLTLFSILVSSLLIFFNQLNVVYLFVTILLLIVFFIYINKKEDAFIDISFFKNHKFLSALFVEFSLYFSFLILSFTFGFVLNTVYGIELSRVSWVLFPSFIAATFMGMVSGKINDKIGKNAMIHLGSASLIIGLVINALFIEESLLILSIGAIFFAMGYPLMYSSVVDNVVSTLEPSQVGRGLGFVDLTMKTSQAIGLALYSNLLKSSALNKLNLFNLESAEVVSYSNIWLIAALVVFLGLITYRLTSEHAQKVAVNH